MKTPWSALPQESPYVIAEDKQAVDSFNAGLLEVAKDYKICTWLLPEPYFGDPLNAAVILLNLNPGCSPEDDKFYADPARKQICRDNLEHKPSQYPFVLLNSDFKDFSGPRWWRRKLKALITAVGDETVAKKICCIEYFPYHSAKFGAGELPLESQEYSFQLVREAITSQKIILVMRAWENWSKSVPKLVDYPHKYHLKFPQGAWITPNNVLDNGYNAIAEAVNR